MVLKFRGGGRLALRVVSAYRPVPESGPYTVYQQQLNYYTIIGNNKCPITEYNDELVILMEAWIDNRDHVVLIIDANEALQNKCKR